MLRASLSEAAPLFTVASCAVEVSGSIHLSEDLIIQYVPEKLNCATYDGAYIVFSVTTGFGLLLLSIPFYGAVASINRRWR